MSFSSPSKSLLPYSGKINKEQTWIQLRKQPSLQAADSSFSHPVNIISSLLIFTYLFILGLAHSMWNFLGQGSNPSHSSDNTRSLTPRLPGNSIILFFKTTSGHNLHFLKCTHFFSFLWLFPWHLELPRLGGKSELQLRPMPQPWQHRIWAESAICVAACSNAGSLTHYTGTGIELASSWTLHWARNLLSRSGNSRIYPF